MCPQTWIRPRSLRRPWFSASEPSTLHVFSVCRTEQLGKENVGKGWPVLAECHSHLCLPSGQFCAGAAAAGGGPRAQKPLSGEGPPPAEPCGKFRGSGSLEPGEEERQGGVKEEGGAENLLSLCIPSLNQLCCLLHRLSSTSLSGPWHPQPRISRWLLGMERVGWSRWATEGKRKEGRCWLGSSSTVPSSPGD